jgi:hypothetical protein
LPGTARKKKTGNQENFTQRLDGKNEKVDCHIASCLLPDALQVFLAIGLAMSLEQT